MSAIPSDLEPSGSISIADHGDVRVVRLVGEHDVSTASDLRAALDASAVTGGLVVSVAETEFIDSAVLHALFAADRQLNQRARTFVLHVATPSIVERVLDVSGLTRQVHCTESLDEAIALAGNPVEITEWSTG